MKIFENPIEPPSIVKGWIDNKEKIAKQKEQFIISRGSAGQDLLKFSSPSP